jgi:hypothetical protein
MARNKVSIKINRKRLDLIQEGVKKIKYTIPQEMRPKFRPAAEILKEDIRDTIERGNSPVKGNKRFVEYSQKYIEDIAAGVYPGKTPRPINLKLSGKMLDSIAAKVTKTGFVVYFTNFLAKIHSTEGPGGRRDKIRKVAPFDNEKWKASVMLRAKKFLRSEAMKKAISKLRRI